MSVGDQYTEKFILLNSGFRTDGAPGAYTISINRSITNIKSLRLISAQIPYTWADINSLYHIPLQEIDNTNPITLVTVPVQNYSATQLATAVQTALNSSSPNTYSYVVSWDSQTGFYTITSSGTFSFAWTTDFVTNKYTSNFMYYALGFNNASTNQRGPDPDLAFATSQVSTGVGVIAHPYVYIQIVPIGSTTYFAQYGFDAMAVVPISGNYGDKLYFNSSSNYPQYVTWSRGTSFDLRYLYVKLTFESGQVIDFQGADNCLLFAYTCWDEDNSFRGGQQL